MLSQDMTVCMQRLYQEIAIPRGRRDFTGGSDLSIRARRDADLGGSVVQPARGRTRGCLGSVAHRYQQIDIAGTRAPVSLPTSLQPRLLYTFPVLGFRRHMAGVSAARPSTQRGRHACVPTVEDSDGDIPDTTTGGNGGQRHVLLLILGRKRRCRG